MPNLLRSRFYFAGLFLVLTPVLAPGWLAVMLLGGLAVARSREMEVLNSVTTGSSVSEGRGG